MDVELNWVWKGKGRSKIGRAGGAIHDSVTSWREDQVWGKSTWF